MKTIYPVFICLFIALISNSCGYFSGDVASGEYASSVYIDHIEVQNVKYRKNGSHRAFLGAIGVVRDGSNVFEARDSSPKELDGLEVHQIASLNVSAEGSATSNAGVKISNNGKLNLSLNKKLNEKSSFDIFQILNIEELINKLNKKENKKLLELISKSNNFRIVTSILVLSNHNKFRQISSNPNIHLRLLNKREHGKPLLQTSVRIRNNKLRKKETLVFSNGMIIGYEYSLFCWKKTEGGWKIADLPTDQPGLVSHCPAGSTSDIESDVSAEK